jgi:hypothetical protein
MIAHLKKQITAAKSGLDVRIRPMGAKWQKASALAADEMGVALEWPNGATGYMPWSAIAVMNVAREDAKENTAPADGDAVN